MKNNIALKLTLYFSVALMVFSIIVGSVFLYLYKSSQTDVYERELLDRAENIASTLSEYMNLGITPAPTLSKGISGKSLGLGTGMGVYLRFIGDIAMSDVWIVDKDLNIITYDLGSKKGEVALEYSSLPKEAEQLIETVLLGSSDTSIGYSTLMGESTLTVGAPLFDGKNKVMGAVLLHSPLSINQDEANRGIGILSISILFALIIAFGISVIFAYRFTKPLKKMKNITLSLAEGEYGIKNSIGSQDEIGQLASSIDILSDKLKLASEESEKLEKIRREFVANISHELKTPVTVIKSTLEGFIEGVITDENKKIQYQKQMLREANNLQRLIGDLLELSKLQNLDYPLEKSKISISQLMEDTLRSARQLGDKKMIKIDYSKVGQEFELIGDYGRLRQMIMIILDNAIKFSYQNQTVNVKLTETEIRISNIGEGIKEEDISHIFDRFYKSRSEINKEGSGLGLPIAKEIANRHTMDIRVINEVSDETTFIIKYK